MSINQIIYLLLLSISLLVSVWCRKSDAALRIFPVLLLLSLVTEIVVSIRYHHFHKDYNFIYHAYLPLEYSLTAVYFYRQSTKKLTKKLIFWSIALYVIVSGLISLFVTPLTEHPGLSFNLEGVLLITWSLLALFSVEVNPVIPIVRLPVFWICLGLLTFHSGIFFFNFIYSYISETHTVLAEELHQLVIKNLNYLLYFFILIAFLCSERITRYT